MPRVSWIVELSDPAVRREVDALRHLLSASGFGDADALHSADAVVVWSDRTLPDDLVASLATADVRVVLAGPTLSEADPARVLAERAGLLGSGVTAPHDVRVRAADGTRASLRPVGHQHARSDHAGEHAHVTDRVQLLEKVADDVEVLLTARIGLTEHPVLTWRPATRTAVWTLGTTPEAVAAPLTGRSLVQVLRLICDVPDAPSVGVGLLGYGAIGHEHSRAVRAVDGLHLSAVCDTATSRLEAARAAAPSIVTTPSADELIARDDVDLVIVSTPPSTHAAWALKAIEAGKHVVVEKPFAIRTAEADEVMAAADAAGLVAGVYQNRRYDPDYLALRRVVRSDAIGEVFQIESFVGGYGHPCNLWHSDEEVSGGAFYDWGSHALDQILDLVPTQIAYVTAATHKRQWHDVTNADHSRVTIRFVDGSEAEFVHSDLAAALKPRWYVLGSRGAVVGDWRTERILGRNDIGVLEEDVLAPADSPPTMTLHAADGSITRLATPAGELYGYHRELAERIRFGLPMSVTAAQSRRVLAVMEAASLSAAEDGRPVVPA